MRKTNDSKKNRKQQILDAADHLLGDVGYDAVSARDIAERAGVNKALVFYYWGSKAQLYAAVLERYYRRHREALENAFSTEGTLTERVHRLVDAYLDFMEQNRLYPRLVQQQVAGGGSHKEFIYEHLATFFEWTTDLLQEITPREGPLAARHFFVTISGMVTNYFTYTPALADRWHGDPLSNESLAERRKHVHWLVDTLLEGLNKANGNG